MKRMSTLLNLVIMLYGSQQKTFMKIWNLVLEGLVLFTRYHSSRLSPTMIVFVETMISFYCCASDIVPVMFKLFEIV